MLSSPLTSTTKAILNKINALLPQAKYQICSVPTPGKVYDSGVLHQTVGTLVSELVVDIEHVDWAIFGFSQYTSMRIKTGWMIVVPLSNGEIIPGGILEKGYSVYLKDERGYAPGVPMVTVMPKPEAINLAKRRFMSTIHQAPLSSTGDKLREEIKTLLSLATIIVNGNEGQKEYVSDALTFRIGSLAWDLQLHEVSNSLLNPFFD